MMKKGILEFREGRDYIDQVFTLKEMDEKAQKKSRVYVDFIDLEKAYDKVNREV